MKNLPFICPVCGGELTQEEKSCRCNRGHCFDIAKQGYVNLLTGAGRGRHGDDKFMVKARAEFLNKGWYDRLSGEIAACAGRYAVRDCAVLDAGCGEGKYTLAVLNALTSAGINAEMIGVDISKEALIYAAKRSPDFHLAVASSAALPLADGSVDILLNIFSPFIAEEFFRVLRPDGVLIRVIPLEKHLWELKKLIYDTPYENTVGELNAEGFTIEDRRRVDYRIRLSSSEDIMELFRMTPYYYKTGRADQEKAASAKELETSLEFGIIVYRKEK